MADRPKSEDSVPLSARARRLARAKPADHLLAASIAPASLPMIGKRLEPLGAATALGMWGTRHLPQFVSTTAKSLLGPRGGAGRVRAFEDARKAALDALRPIVRSTDLADTVWPAPERIPPMVKAFEYRHHLHRSTIRYGGEPAQVLDVWRRPDLPAQPAPVLIFVPGGVWVHGSRTLQGYALLSHLAELGWVCLSIDYRVAPHHRWPDHIVDVKTAIAWARANVDKFGGDRHFVAIAGASAGGHLAALAGLTPGDFGDPAVTNALPEGGDTSVDAVVSLYGRYDWQDRSTKERREFVDFLQRVVVGRSIKRHPEIYRDASPIARVRPDAPPFLVVHGSGDTIIPVGQARVFQDRLRRVSRSVVGYLELPGAGHAFDMTDGTRTGVAATAIGLFLNQIHRDRTLAGHDRGRTAAERVI